MPSRGPFVNAANANRKQSHQSKVIHNPNLLPQPPRLLTNIHHSPDLFLVLLALSENQDQVIFVSPAASKVIGDLSVKLILKPDLQARGSPFLVLLVFRALEVNRTTGLKTCSSRLDISFSQLLDMYPSYSEYFRERDSISLVDFDYDRNLFEFEQNSALPVLKGRLRSCLVIGTLLVPIVLLSILLNSVIGFHSLVHLVRRVFLTISQLSIMRLSWSRLSLN